MSWPAARRPERGWFEGGWEAITREIELGPLSLAESEELLGAHGLSGARRDELAHWAGGSPLALTPSIAAVEDGGWSAQAGESGEMVRTLVRRLAEAEIEGRYRDVLGIALHRARDDARVAPRRAP